MTRLEVLKDLARKVEAGEYTTSGDADDMWLKWHDAFSPRDWKSYNELAQRAFHGSLDAAKALHEALLPGYTRSVDATAPECGITVELHPVDNKGNPVPKPIISADMSCESRAWLLDILKALIAEEEGE